MIMYKYLSSCYDEFMQDVDYDAWAKKLPDISEIAKKASSAAVEAVLLPGGSKKWAMM